METYTDSGFIIERICSHLANDNPANWCIGVGLIRTLGNPFELGVEAMYIYRCSPKTTLQVIDFMVKNYGVRKDGGWTYPEIDNTELVLYKKRGKSIAA